jgi:periplasmic divalent cation tolerance protein
MLAVFGTTLPNTETAKILSLKLLERHLAYCTNLIAVHESMYWWKGKIETAQETLLIIKSSTELEDRLVEFVKSNHPYQVPFFFKYGIENLNNDYINSMINSRAST